MTSTACQVRPVLVALAALLLLPSCSFVQSAPPSAARSVKKPNTANESRRAQAHAMNSAKNAQASNADKARQRNVVNNGNVMQNTEGRRNVANRDKKASVSGPNKVNEAKKAAPLNKVQANPGTARGDREQKPNEPKVAQKVKNGSGNAAQAAKAGGNRQNARAAEATNARKDQKRDNAIKNTDREPGNVAQKTEKTDPAKFNFIGENGKKAPVKVVEKPHKSNDGAKQTLMTNTAENGKTQTTKVTAASQTDGDDSKSDAKISGPTIDVLMGGTERVWLPSFSDSASNVLKGALLRASEAVEAASAASGLDSKLREISANPLVGSSVKAMKETIGAVRRGANTLADSSVGRMAGKMATRASESVGDATVRMMEAVGESTKDAAESVRAKIHDEFGAHAAGVIFDSVGADEWKYFLALLGAMLFIFIVRTTSGLFCCCRRRAAHKGKKLKIDERIDDCAELIEEGSFHAKDIPSPSDRTLQQPFQLYHEFEYTMRKRYQNSPMPSLPPPGYGETPELCSISRSLSYGCVEETNNINGEQKGRVQKNGKKSISKGTMLVWMCCFIALGVVASYFVIPKDVSFGSLYLVTAEYVNRLIMGGASGYVL